MILGEYDHVVGAWADTPAGPGWSNRLVWVCFRSALDGSYRVDCFQPEEQTKEMAAIFLFCVVASNRLLAAVEQAVEDRKPKRKTKTGGGR